MELRSVEPGKPCQKTNKLPESEFVSVVIPCYNEERFIVKALEQLAGQYEKSRFEIIVVDGMSEDRTRDLVSDFKANHPDLSITIIDNPARRIPTALNLGVSAAHAEIIARMDAHAVPSEGYIRRCVEVLGQHNAGVVGMPCRVRAGTNTLLARAIANAVSHPFGIGDAKYRLSKGAALQEQVDTVAFACFRKSLWKELGGFNESLLTNEDYDFNYRLFCADLIQRSSSSVSSLWRLEGPDDSPASAFDKGATPGGSRVRFVAGWFADS